MSKKDSKPDESTEPDVASEENEEVGEPDELSVEAPSVVAEEPKEEKPKKKPRKSTKRTRLSVLQAAVLETVRERPQRPRAIQTIIRGVGGVEVPRNDIVRSLNELKKKGLVDKISAKAWQAK